MVTKQCGECVYWGAEKDVSTLDLKTGSEDCGYKLPVATGITMSKMVATDGTTCPCFAERPNSDD